MMATKTVNSLALAAATGSLALIFIVAVSPGLVLPVNIWIMIPISAATLVLGIFIVRKGRSLTRNGGNNEYLAGVMLSVAGVIISLVGTGGLLFLFLPWD